MIAIFEALKEQAHKVSVLEALRKGVHNISAPPAAEEPIGKAKGTEIHFHPKLVDELIAEHRQLASQLNEIEQALAQKNYRKLHDKLEAFSAALGDHILKKNIKLYIYLQHSIQADEQASVNVSAFKRGMTAIRRRTNAFLNEHDESVLHGDIKPTFSRELGEIAKALAAHTDDEESELYPLYRPPDAYA